MLVILVFFALPEGEEAVNIQFLQIKLAGGHYKTKDTDDSHKMQTMKLLALTYCGC